MQKYSGSLSVNLGNSASPFGAYPSVIDVCTYSLYDSIYTHSSLSIISQVFLACKSFMNYHFDPYNFTLTHWAVLSNNSVALNLLHDQGANMDRPDVLGFTPIHHAALKSNLTMVDLLRKWGVNLHHKNKWGGTYADLLRFQGLASDEKSNTQLDHKSFFTAHHINPIEIKEECRSPEVKYIQENIISSAVLLDFWHKSVDMLQNKKFGRENNKKFIKYFKDYEEYTKRPPPLSIASVNELQGGCGVYTKKLIKKGKIITEYVGEIFASTRKGNYIYRVNDILIDGEEYRNAGPMINVGFPNAYAYMCNALSHCKNNFPGMHGFPFTRLTFKANRDINPGEQIFINYGSTYIGSDALPKKMFKELNPKDRDAFAKELKKILNDGEQGLSSEDRDLLRDKMEYLATTPNALKEILGTGIFTLQEFEYFRTHMLNLHSKESSFECVKKNFNSAKNFFIKKSRT